MERAGIVHPELVDTAFGGTVDEILEVGKDVEQPNQAEDERTEMSKEEPDDERAGTESLHGRAPEINSRPRQTCCRREALAISLRATGTSASGDSQYVTGGIWYARAVPASTPSRISMRAAFSDRARPKRD